MAAPLSFGSPFGSLIIATGIERDPERAQMVDDHLDELVATAVLLGASPVIVVHDGIVRVPEPARDFLMPRQARDDLSALRMGLMQLTNSPVGSALILPIEAYTIRAALLGEMIADATRKGVLLAAWAVNGTLGFPLFAARDTWRELMTTEGGLDGVLRRMGARVLAVEGGD